MDKSCPDFSLYDVRDKKFEGKFMINLTCNACHSTHEIPEEYIGQKVQCDCGAKMIVTAHQVNDDGVLLLAPNKQATQDEVGGSVKVGLPPLKVAKPLSTPPPLKSPPPPPPLKSPPPPPPLDPPPLVQENKDQEAEQSTDTSWFYQPDEGASFEGPYTSDKFKSLAQDGTITPSTLIMYQGVKAKASDVDGLSFNEVGISVENLDHDIPLITRPNGSLKCPHCWWKYEYEDLLFIAGHQSLTGDPVLGPDVQKRFIPTEFNSSSQALDSLGVACTDMACPRCRLYIPKSTLRNNDDMIISIVGAPGSGKSFLLTSMVWKLRMVLGRDFALNLMDADPSTNKVLHDYEDLFFANPDPNSLVVLRKTEESGELYNEVLLDGSYMQLPNPFFFNLKGMPHHPWKTGGGADFEKGLVLYDNAGESFQPGKDSAVNPATRHLAHSDIVFFLFDPTQDPQFRRRLATLNHEQLQKSMVVSRQEILMSEMITRMERYNNIDGKNLFDKTVVITISKFDLWKDLLPFDIENEPWASVQGHPTKALDLDAIYAISLIVRNLFLEINPQLVHTAEAHFKNVVFLPCSAIGRDINMKSSEQGLGVQSSEIDPFWVSSPILLLLEENGLLTSIGGSREGAQIVVAVKHSNKYHVEIDGQSLVLSEAYLGKRLISPKSLKPFIVVKAQDEEPVSGHEDDLSKLIDSL